MSYPTTTTTTTTTRRVDPTDAGRPAAPAASRYPADQLPTLQLRRGICSAPGCRWPIARWCDACGVKLCYDHLQDHPCPERSDA